MRKASGLFYDTEIQLHSIHIWSRWLQNPSLVENRKKLSLLRWSDKWRSSFLEKDGETLLAVDCVGPVALIKNVNILHKNVGSGGSTAELIWKSTIIGYYQK